MESAITKNNATPLSKDDFHKTAEEKIEILYRDILRPDLKGVLDRSKWDAHFLITCIDHPTTMLAMDVKGHAVTFVFSHQTKENGQENVAVKKSADDHYAVVRQPDRTKIAPADLEEAYRHFAGNLDHMIDCARLGAGGVTYAIGRKAEKPKTP